MELLYRTFSKWCVPRAIVVSNHLSITKFLKHKPQGRWDHRKDDNGNGLQRHGEYEKDEMKKKKMILSCGDLS